METWFIEQPLDHSNPQNQPTAHHKYHVNTRYVGTASPPIFLMLAMDINAWADMGFLHWMDEGLYQWCQWAEDFHARMYVLEHRYFGVSQPFTNTTAVTMQWLQTEQVLADIAVFINTMNALNNDTNPQWILFGGSYACSLAAAMRLRYPDLSVGAVASSAPLQAVTDFYGYKQTMESALSTYGGPQCDESVRKLFYTLQRKLNHEGDRFKLKQEFCQYNDWHTQNYIDEKSLHVPTCPCCSTTPCRATTRSTRIYPTCAIWWTTVLISSLMTSH